jgi:hypothetical protein
VELPSATVVGVVNVVVVAAEITARLAVPEVPENATSPL